MYHSRRLLCRCLGLLLAACVVLTTVTAQAAVKQWRFDCGTAESPVLAGYQRLTAEDMYSASKGYGWEGEKPTSVKFENPGPLNRYWVPREKVFADNLNDLNCDAVVSGQDLLFRADVPNGTYRVSIVIGDMAKAIGSFDVSVNGKLVGEHVAAWTVGEYRILLRSPYGWWARVRSTVPVEDGIIRIKLTKNQSYYDQQMAEQSTLLNPYRAWWSFAPEKQPPYYYIGWAFAENSLMAIEIAPDVLPPVVGKDDKLSLTKPIASPALSECIALFNKGDFAGAVKALQGIAEPDAQAAKAVVELWLSGRLEVEMEKELVPDALRILRQYVPSHPEEVQLAEILQDAEAFDKALNIHLTRGELGKNHFIENDKAIGWFWLIKEDSPLYYKSQLYKVRAGHMLNPYFPTLGTELEILKELEKKFPDNRYVKYFLYWEWENHGDGTHFDDWYMVDYTPKVKDAPAWVRELYPAFQNTVDWSEWFVRFKQGPKGTIGGGLSDDVEMVGAFGYYGFTGRGVSELAIDGARKLCESNWKYGGVNDEIGYVNNFSDAEHSAEPTGDTLPMMIKIDYGNPLWIERSMKTGRIMRDLWTDYNVKGFRHFRANFFGAMAVGTGDQTNDSWINYRAVAPANAVLWYNDNPGISKLLVELADGWLAAAMSTDRGKPQGVIPGEVSFPDGIIGGTNSPNWYTPSHAEGTVNYGWPYENYKDYMSKLLITAYQETGDTKYLEPLRLEYELAARYGRAPKETAQAGPGELWNYPPFGTDVVYARWPDLPKGSAPPTTPVGAGAAPAQPKPEPGTEKWVAENLANLEAWPSAKKIVEGRTGELQDDVTKEQIAQHAAFAGHMLRVRWPLMTTESSATDRVAFHGVLDPFFFYTGGGATGRNVYASVTYDNTTRDFAAAVMATDPQGFRLLYCSLTPDAREIGIIPWNLEPGGTYTLRYGPDANDDEVIDSVTEREFDFPQRGTPITIKVTPRTTYVVEVNQVKRGRGAVQMPDPGISADDIMLRVWGDGEWHMLTARVHNVGSKAVRNVEVAFYDGDPAADGTPIGTSVIPNIEAPNDLESRAVIVGLNWMPSKEVHDVYVVVDPKDEIKDEITTFNNVAHKKLP